MIEKSELNVIVFFSMLMPKKNRIAIYEHLFKEGVMVAKKDFHAPKHPEVEAVPNLHVIKALQVSDDKICKTVTKGETLKVLAGIFAFHAMLQNFHISKGIMSRQK